MTTAKVAALKEGDVIVYNDEQYTVSGIDWEGPRGDMCVYVCSEDATDWKLPLLPGDRVEVRR